MAVVVLDEILILNQTENPNILPSSPLHTHKTHLLNRRPGGTNSSDNRNNPEKNPMLLACYAKEMNWLTDYSTNTIVLLKLNVQQFKMNIKLKISHPFSQKIVFTKKNVLIKLSKIKIGKIIKIEFCEEKVLSIHSLALGNK